MKYLMKVWGPFELRSHQGVSMRPSVRKSCALLAILALSQSHRQSRKWLQSILWSESEAAQGSASLRQELARLRRHLGNAICADNIDIWLDVEQFEFDHLAISTPPPNTELLQGIDIDDEAFEDWLREQRQFFANQLSVDKPMNTGATIDGSVVRAVPNQCSTHPPASGLAGKKCTVVFASDAKGSVEANVAATFFSELLYSKLSQYDIFTCIGAETFGECEASRSYGRSQYVSVVRIAAFANRDEVCLGVQVDNGLNGPRLAYQSVVLPISISRIRESTSIGQLVQHATETLLERVVSENLPLGAAHEAFILANEARKLTFKLKRGDLIKADLLLARAYELDPHGQYIAWRGFLRNTAFFQHRTSDIFEDRFSSDALSLEALSQAPWDSIVQAFSSQLDYVNQGNLAEPMLKAQRAVEIDRTDPLARALLSNSLTVNGHLEDGYKVALQSISLASGSRNEFYFHHFACMAATAAGEYETALHHARSSTSYAPHFVSPRRYEVALALSLGDSEGVDHAVDAMRQVEPEFTTQSLLDPNYPVNTLRRLPIIEAVR